MRLTALFPQFRGLRLDYLHAEPIGLTLIAATTAKTARCPLCHHHGHRVHSRYQRRVTDLPCAGPRSRSSSTPAASSAQLPTARARPFANACPRWSRPVPAAATACAPRLKRSGSPSVGKQVVGSLLASILGMPTRADTLLRLVCAAPPAAIEPPQVLGIDDWAWKKATRYGTILCDLERHHVIDLLPNRSADTVAAWLRAHPSITLITRDRRDLYADGATRGAPDAIQVADRFHLLKNLGDALERFLQQKRSLLKQATPPKVAPLPPPRLQRWQERMERESEQRHAPWITRYEQVIALHIKGAAIANIARAVGISGTTVYHGRPLGSMRPGCPPGRKQYGRRRTPLDPYKEHLLRRWNEGCHVATRLWREIQVMGYGHSYTNVSRFLARLRLPVGQRPSIFREHGTADKALTPRKVALLFIRHPDDLTEEQRTTVDQVCTADAAFAVAHRLSQDFAALLREREGERLDEWIVAACGSVVTEVRRFAEGLLLDEAAVRAGLTLEWSKGQTEGHVNRLKTLKRQMYDSVGEWQGLRCCE